LETLDGLAKADKLGTPEAAELRRRLGWEFDGMRLHEYYFENLGGKGGINKGGKLGKKIARIVGATRLLKKSSGPWPV